jgi:PAS domain S-box-containing protein
VSAPDSRGSWDLLPAGPQAGDSPADDEAGQLRRELARTRARLDDISRLVSDWIWETDRQLRIRTVTPRVMEVLGYHPAELTGRPFAELVGADAPLPLTGAPERARPFRDVETTVVDRWGGARRVRLSGLPVFDEVTQRFTGYRGTAQDVTELRAREHALLEAKNAAEEASRTKSEFLAQMSHELRTPLNAIIGFAEVMHAEQLGPLGADKYREYAGDIAGSARHLAQVINDVLDVAKLEAGKFQLNEEEVAPGELAARAVRIVRPRAEDAGVALTLADTGGAAVTLRADGHKLLQVLLNILSNAVKFTPSGGRTDVRAGPSEDGGYVFTVRDTGIGMSAEDQRVALSPFGQVDSSLARRFEGTGLGLPLSKALTELHDGALEIDSAPGEGTCVNVRLPAGRVRWG